VTDYRKNGGAVGGGGGAGLPAATGSGEVPISTGAGTTYVASPFGAEVGIALGGLIGSVAGKTVIGDGAGSVATTSADVSALLAAANASAARAAIGVAGTTLGHLWERPAPASVALGSTFISSDDLTEQVSSGAAVTPATITSGWMQRIPSGIGAGRAGLVGRAYVNSVDLSAYVIDATTIACLFEWDGLVPASTYSEVLTLGDGTNEAVGVHVLLQANAGNTDLMAYTANLGTVLISNVNAALNAVGLHAIVIAPVINSGHKWRFSYDGSPVAEVAINGGAYVAPGTNSISFGGRADGSFPLSGKVIELAVWSTPAVAPAPAVPLSNANILALATLPATPTYELPESASTGAATIMLQARRFDPRTSATLPARGVATALTVVGTKATL
jgi:hypothetical protein